MQPLILIIDDKAEFLDIFGTALRAAGYRVITAADGPAGISEALADRPDLVLLDVDMPNMNGADVLAAMRERPELKDLKVVFLTNLGSAEPEAQLFNSRIAKEAGALTYLKKTENLDVLIQRIRDLLA